MSEQENSWRQKEFTVEIIDGSSELWIHKVSGSESVKVLSNGGRFVLERYQVKALVDFLESA